MMTTRLLPPDEWPRLEQTALAGVWAQLPPTAIVLAVEDDAGTLLGAWALVQLWHAEGVWIAPAHRGKAGVARRLWALLHEVGRALGVSAILTGQQSPEVARLLAHVGAVPVPGGAYVVPLGPPVTAPVTSAPPPEE